VQDLLARGRDRARSAKSIDELLAGLAATLGELAFLQLGFVPRGHYREERIALVASNWKLNSPVRTVQYVQSRRQLAAQEEMRRRRKRVSNPEPPLQVSGDIVNAHPSGTKPR
jgi:hypothetical protein